MALVKCHECGQSKSDTAKACPHCGVKTYFLWKQNLIAGGILLAVFVFLPILAQAGQNASATTATRLQPKRLE
jgi:hypothetical protein